MALGPLGHNAADSLQILKANGQFLVQLICQLGRVWCRCRPRLGLAQALLQRQILLNQVLVLH